MSQAVRPVSLQRWAKPKGAVFLGCYLQNVFLSTNYETPGCGYNDSLITSLTLNAEASDILSSVQKEGCGRVVWSFYIKSSPALLYELLLNTSPCGQGVLRFIFV